MGKRVLVSGLLGGLTLIAWMVLSNGLLGLNSRVALKPVPDESRVYAVLSETLEEPGGYVCNPPRTLASDGSPPGEPVYGIRFSGIGHDTAGDVLLIQLLVVVLASFLGAWLLSLTAERILNWYSRRVLFFAGLGLFVAFLGCLVRFDLGGLPLGSTVLLALQDLAGWTLAGLVVAGLITRRRGTPPRPS